MKFVRKAFLVILLVSSLGFAADDRFKELQTKFICLCGCNMGPLNMCTMVGCGHSVPMKAELKKMIDDGKTDEQITETFVSKYGKWVLSAPTMEGFNITAWVMPFVALIAGLAVVAAIVKKWRAGTAVAGSAEIVAENVKYHDRIEDELKKFTPED